jgi:ABC-type phosphate/phosphonate transport system substrate-binding protein
MFLGAAAGVLLGTASSRAASQTVRIGIVQSIFRDTEEKNVRASIKRFRRQMERETGVAGDSMTIGDIWLLAERLEAEKLELGVAFGFEFAWARKKYGDLKPMVIAVNQDRYIPAHIIGRAGSGMKDFDALKAKSLAVPAHTKEYCRLYAERECQARGRSMSTFFGKLARPDNLEDALDDVVDGVVDAALVDAVGLHRYELRKPVRFAKLADVARSAPFPASAVFYHPGGMEPRTVDRFRRALLRLPGTADGQQTMLEWRITGFEEVPDDYNQALDNIASVYPPPRDHKE